MNAPHPLQNTMPGAVQNQAQFQPEAEDDGVDLLEYWDILVDNRWAVAAIAAIVFALGTAYAVFARPVYEANLLVQVEDQAGSAKSLIGEAASLFDVKTAATAEIEILRSRMIVGQAVDNTLMYVDAKPRYIPFVGAWMSRRAKELSAPGIFGYGGWVSGTERINVQQFDVPTELEGTRFRLTQGTDGNYELAHPELDAVLKGRVAVPLQANTPVGSISLLVTEILGKPGAQFNLVRNSRLYTIEELQEKLKLAEKGRQSGVIEATLQSTDAQQLTVVLNEIGRQYVRQNIERKAAEAQKTLEFLDVQLPTFKKQLDQSEEAYNRYRNQQGTVALDEEAKLILGRSVDLQSKLLEAQQRRRELASRFTAEHPVIQTLDAQISAWNREISALNQRVRGMPTVQQDAVRLERDVKVNNELYQQLRNNILQLQLVREGKIGNVRLIDNAVLPEEPVKPKRLLIIAASLLLGLAAGFAFGFARNAFFRGLRNPQEIEAHGGLNVYSTIPLSQLQLQLARKVSERQPGVHILDQVDSQDMAVESLRSLRTALQFAMLDAPNNRVLVTGATPGVGKSFVSANFAAVLASANKRVLLVDADLRKGHLNYYFGLQRHRGLSELIAGSLKPADAIRRDVLPNLDFLPTGVIPPNPAELLLSSSFIQVLEQLSALYDVVLIDSAPVLAAADTLSLAPHVGTLLLVARAQVSHMGEIGETNRRLAHAGARVTGVIFNAMDLSRRHYGSYGYKYGGYRYRQYSYQSANPGQS
jgi:tyrosine-protein kinase Etk/Wzc